MALNGNEVLFVDGVTPTGMLAGVTFPTTTAAIAALSGGGGGSTQAPITNNTTLTAANSGKTFLNTGATNSVTISLPPAVATIGQAILNFTFYVDAAFNLVVGANGSDTIVQPPDITTSAGGTLSNAVVGSMLKISCFKTGQWNITNIIGEWTIA